MKLAPQQWQYIIGSLAILAILAASYTFLEQRQLQQTLKDTSTDTTAVTEKLQQQMSDVESLLVALQTENEQFAQTIAEATENSDSLQEAFKRVTSNVETLEKITTTDEELLQKYSKVYFLNEHYVPEDLRTIPDKYVYNPERSYKIHEQVWPYLEDLLDTANSDGVDLQIISAFRSFGEQAVLKGSYTVTYGAGTANQFSADQGYSEHQLGTTVDFTNPTVGATFSGFAASDEFAWLEKNAHRFGFILSYPKENEHYQFEPWHWRFVGVKLARYLHERDKYFYDLSQREINEYIADLFE